MTSLCKDIHCILLPVPALSHQQWLAVNQVKLLENKGIVNFYFIKVIFMMSTCTPKKGNVADPGF